MTPRANPHHNGTIHRFANFPAKQVLPRHVDIWCPPGYAAHPQQRYPVIYMHDGQNLFDPSLSFGGVTWGMDEAISHLMENKGFPGALVVGIWNIESRWREFMPQKPYKKLIAQGHASLYRQRENVAPVSDKYLRFIVKELKPVIDATYHSRPDQANTFIMGSSMGGLISLYAISEYPHVFGGAGCLSTHWVAGGEHLVNAMAEHLPEPKSHKLYFDFGTETADSDYEPFQRQLDECVRQAGYTENENWLTRKFEGAEHSERSWRERVHIPLEFLLGL